MVLESRNPASGELVAAYPEMTADAVARNLRAGADAFQGWRDEPFAARGAVLRGVADALLARTELLTRLMAAEMGKPLAQGKAEVEKCAWVCRHYAEHAEALLAPETVETEAARSFVAFSPLGLVLAVMPWNFPLWQVLRFAAPALMAGNCGLLKHASNVSGCALAIAECFRAAGAPPGILETVLLGSARVHELIAAPEISAVTLTGSTPAGRAVASAAGQHLKKTVLELGGSDPYLVLEDADLEMAAEACVTSRLLNSGQSCIAAKRFLVVPSVRARFEELFVAKMKTRRVGDPFDPASDLGPLARVDLRDALHDQVERSVRAGARQLLGGVVPPGPGAFYPPTVLTDVRPGMAVHDEETFGPVAAIVPVRDEAEAVRLANQSPFGLGAAVFTQDAQRGERLADRLEAGSVFVNAYVRSDPRLPFGGVKESGYGRELSSYGIREFVNVKTVYRA
jgi:succinate-semialdehyde dehydrogenase / glutarate-semialdehyde dehydrogenase